MKVERWQLFSAPGAFLRFGKQSKSSSGLGKINRTASGTWEGVKFSLPDYWRI